MNRQVAFAYAIAGLAVAVALIAVVGSSAGLFETRSSFEPAAGPAPELRAPATATPDAPSPATPSPGAVLVSNDGGAAAEPEIVYVDAPARARGDDDDDDHERREHHGRRRHHDDDDD